MFAQLIALALALPFVAALTINAPTDATTGGTITLTWSAASTDPAYFTLQLVNPAFHNTFAIANNVQTSLGTITITLPQVPVDSNYQLEAINPSNVNDIYATSSTFSIGAQTSATTTPASTTSGASASSSSAAATTVSGTVVTPTTTSPASSAASTGTATTSTASATSTNLNGVAAKFNFGAAPLAVVALSAVAGAALLF
ncbi:hypothetical protein ID866_8175 [Astraeus odoratus]|nr:hypothetical protein ID866_8175 [Astraeus odoratus]